MRRALPVLLALALLALLPAGALAARDQEATFQDDNELIYTTSEGQARTLDTLKQLGVDRIRVTLLWRFLAPDPKSRQRPENFDASDPDAYPPGTWDRYDNLVRGAYERGVRVNFNLTGPSPRWANKQAPRSDIQDNYEPSPAAFGEFVQAVGRRYSGSSSDAQGTPIPRVDYWSIWNEPNHSGWLTPTWQKIDGRFVERSASLYRELLGAAWNGLRASDHGSDTILFGETAPSGNDSMDVKRFMKPLTFVRALYCVDRRLSRLKGRAARRLNCPSSPRTFVRRNPALFKATGYAHHPYQLLTAPNIKNGDRDWVTMATLHRLTRTLDKLQRRYGQRKRFPLYLTEFGYQTPPDSLGVSKRKQAIYLNQAEYIASRNPRVRTLGQFLLIDNGRPVGLTFQSGLISRKGRRKKPSYAAYRLPVWVSGKGARRRVWGVVRPAARNARVLARIQFKRKGSGRFKTVRTVRTSGAHNEFSARLGRRGAGSVRVVYKKLRSRSANTR